MAARQPVRNFSPWAIGEAHWDQRDLYTRDSRTADAGYGRGPSIHPEVGSYAYPRSPREREVEGRGRPQLREDGPEEELHASPYERQAWPWLNYHDDPNTRYLEEHPPLWSRVKETLARVTGRSHAGRGPRNWRRSDESIRESVCEALTYHGELDATDVEVEVKEAEVTLRGTVRDRHSKRLAERIVESCHGVEDVHNRLKVRREDDTGDANVAFVMPARAFG
jgi:hypothetical protein